MDNDKKSGLRELWCVFSIIICWSLLTAKIFFGVVTLIIILIFMAFYLGHLSLRKNALISHKEELEKRQGKLSESEEKYHELWEEFRVGIVNLSNKIKKTDIVLTELSALICLDIASLIFFLFFYFCRLKIL